jgi:hypothetical protein
MNDRMQASSPDRARAEPGAEGRVRLDRRALLRGGAGAAPVLLTLASSPVSASTSCVVASSFVSVATFKSRNPTATTVSCASRTVEDWRRACFASPDMACVQPLVSASCFGGTSSTYNTKMLKDVLCDPSGVSYSGELGVLQHLIALNLSVTQGYMSAPAGNIGPAYLGAVWSNYKANGGRYKLPGSGINWGSSQLISWLRYQLNYSMPV